MIAVIFEVIPHANRRQDYFDAAAVLRQHLDDIDGFISIERFESLTNPGKILSLSFWRDEEAVSSGERLNFTDQYRKMVDTIFLKITGCALPPLFATTD